MTEKRFSTNGYYIYDHFHDEERWLVNEVEANEIVDVMNNLDTKARERSKALSKLQKENNEIKQLIHTMFSTFFSHPESTPDLQNSKMLE